MDLFFDSHVHLTLKNQFSKNGNSTSCWRAITRDDLKDGLPQLLKIFGLGLLDKTFSSQSSPDQLIPCDYKLVVVPLFAPDVDLVKAISSKKIFIKILKKYRNTNFGKVLNFERYGFLQQEINPFSIVENDFALLTKTDPNNAGRSVVFLKNKADFKPDLPNQLAVVFSVEGVHCLRSDLRQTDEGVIFDDIKTNLESLLARDLAVIMINVTHIDNCNGRFCNQAYAMDGMRVNNFDEKSLRPLGNGMTALGKELVELLESHRIVTDIKHMSLQSRKDLYAFRKEKGITSPLVSSHSGLAGIPFDSPGESFKDYIYDGRKEGDVYRLKVGKVKKYKFSRLFPGVGFNSTSINLFDEDIKEIYESTGLLGISMDERVLGYSKAHKLNPDTYSANVGFIEDFLSNKKRVLLDTDFMSESEYKGLGLHNTTKGTKLNHTADADQLIDLIKGNSSDIPQYQFYHFLNHVLHCVALGNQYDGARGVEKMLTQILCVGSDFDGLIDAMDWCLNCGMTKGIKRKFIEQFPEILAENNLQLPAGLTIQKVADRLFYENGRDFVLSRLS
ncbi:hypothetical protein GCM10009119_27550 [Algoriphagus jejuensis]|uniref:Membrane dipeptidase (Peptidase family M19) n=1 Tax=Algoriphagus jejuensis TaxID=419934 RepID=A0ABN1N1Q9_9BACT